MTENDRDLKILVTGLTLSVNRGGPAMALSFIDLINKHLSADFIFAVPKHRWNLETEWAEKYQVKIVPTCEITDYFLLKIPTPLIQGIAILFRRKWVSRSETREIYSKTANAVEQFQNAARSSDCIINLNGIAFVGDGTRPWSTSFYELSTSFFSKKCKKPFFRFTQSYGPFDNFFVRIIARHEFTQIPCILARGKLSAQYCQNLVPEKKIYSFPDVAIMLEPADENWLNSFLSDYHLRKKEFVALSPSAVIFNLDGGNKPGLENNHIRIFSDLTRFFIQNGIPVLFVPHTTSPDKKECDRCVAEEVIKSLKDISLPEGMCQVIREELDCRQLKAVIGASKIAIVSRYHALVAALSSGVPSISLGWNDKYLDLLTFYHAGDYAVDSRGGLPSQITGQILEKIRCSTGNHSSELIRYQVLMECEVQKSIILCLKWIKFHVNERES